VPLHPSTASELFDLTTDPREQQNLVAAKASTATALGAWLDRATAGSSVNEPARSPRTSANG
jgi:hypothetical protein